MRIPGPQAGPTRRLSSGRNSNHNEHRLQGGEVQISSYYILREDSLSQSISVTHGSYVL